MLSWLLRNIFHSFFCFYHKSYDKYCVSQQKKKQLAPYNSWMVVLRNSGWSTRCPSTDDAAMLTAHARATVQGWEVTWSPNLIEQHIWIWFAPFSFCYQWDFLANRTSLPVLLAGSSPSPSHIQPTWITIAWSICTRKLRPP